MLCNVNEPAKFYAVYDFSTLTREIIRAEIYIYIKFRIEFNLNLVRFF